MGALTLRKISSKKLTVPLPVGTGVETVDQVSESSVKHSTRREPLGVAYFWLTTFMLIYYARPEDWIPGLSALPLAKIAGILVLLAFLFSLQHIRQRLPQEVVYLILLTVQLFATVPMSSVWPGGALQKTLDFVKVVVIVIVMALSVNGAKRLRRLIFVQAASVAAIAAVAVWKGRLLGGRLQGVLNGIYSNPNDLALAIVISLPLCLALMFLSRGRLWKAVWVMAMLWMIYAVFLTASRGAFISLIVTTAVCIWEFAIRGRRRYLMPLVVLVAVVLWSSSGVELGQRLEGTFDAKSNVASAYGSSQARQVLFWRSVQVTKEHPFFGVGPGNFQVISGDWHDAHNSYTEMSSEGGVPALILYVLILWSGFKNLSATKRVSRGKGEPTVLARALHASLAGFVVGAVFASEAYQFFPYFLVAYTTTLLWIAKKSASQSKKSESVCQVTPENELYANTTETEMDWHFC